MFQKDYILRMIEMAGKMIAGILGLIKKRELEEATRELNLAYNNFLREDSAFFQAIPVNEITERLLHDHNYTNGHLEILAELLYAESELRLAMEDRKACLEFSEKSLILYEFIDRELKTYTPARISRMDSLQNRIRELKKN
jgi:hypothetical protein